MTDSTKLPPKKLLLQIVDGNEFVLPYIQRQAESENWLVVLAKDAQRNEKYDAAVVLSTANVYRNAADGEIDENAAVIDSHPALVTERRFVADIIERGLRPIVLRCADIIGTGMTGFPMKLAEEIDNGTYWHVENDDQKRVSVVHATDVAKIVFAVACNCKNDDSESVIMYNVSDGVCPTLHDLAEAIAYKLKNKRIVKLTARWKKVYYFFFPFAKKIESRVVACDKLAEAVGYRFKSVISVMREVQTL